MSTKPAATMMEPARHMSVRELDLSTYHPNSISDRINAVPAINASAAFFTFLRANLVLNPSAVSSNTNTPLLEPALASSMFPPPSPSPLAANPPLVPTDDIPPLSLETLDSNDDKHDGLHLVADSVAEMRQRASRALVFHPLCLAGLGASLAAVYRFAYVSARDPGSAAMLACGITMGYFVAIRYFTSGYVGIAEQMDWSWLLGPDGEEDVILGARRDGEVLGALVLHLQANPAFAGKKRSRALALRGGRGVIRAWTTGIQNRGKGIGAELLSAAVRVTKERCGQHAEVGFAKEHANSVMVLPTLFNGGFRRDEVRAARALDGAVAAWEATKKKR